MKGFVDCAGHDAPIHLCGVCGILDIMPHREKHILKLGHKKIKFLIANPNELNKLSRARTEAMHLYTKGDLTYHLHPKAVNTDNHTVVVCDSCFECLGYSTKVTKKPPKQTFKAYDVGSIPSYLPKLTLIECLAISRGIAFQVLINLRAMGSGISQKALRGHSICLPLSTEDGVASDATSLPRTDLHKHIGVVFMGTKPMWKIAR